jgi:hypothetical protein
MIKKIVSGGQTGADRAALDAAIRFSVPHGGWIPKGRLAEDGPLPLTYHLQEMPTASYPARTEQNVIDSDGTLVVSHGPLTGGSALTLELAHKHKKPCMHLDLAEKPVFLSAPDVNAWLNHHMIEILNVAGPKASKDPKIYEATLFVVEGILLLTLLKTEPDPPSTITDAEPPPAVKNPPQTLDEAVNLLLLILDKETMEVFAKRTEAELKYYVGTAGVLIRNEFKLEKGNNELMESCRRAAGQSDLDAQGAATVILRSLWESLRQTKQ